MVWVLPPQGAIPPQAKTFLTFVQDDQQCRIHAEIASGAGARYKTQQHISWQRQRWFQAPEYGAH